MTCPGPVAIFKAGEKQKEPAFKRMECEDGVCSSISSWSGKAEQTAAARGLGQPGVSC